MTDHFAPAALPAGLRTDVAGAPALIVGHVHAIPRHPERGAQVAAFGGGEPDVVATGVLGAPLYALVSVSWATELTEIDLDTGHTHARCVCGLLDQPTGITWYLHPATYDCETGSYALEAADHAAGFHCAAVPAGARAALRGVAGAGLEAPESVPVHNFRLI